MCAERRPYRRESEDARREALLQAVLDLVAEGGPQATTVRAIADRAGVTPGLIRHYFNSKEELIRLAYQQMMDLMTDDSSRSLHGDDAAIEPHERLARFVVDSVTPPVMDPLRLGLWASFIQMLRHEPEFRDIHRRTYHRYRGILQDLITALDRPGADARRCHADAIACNAVIDGLWMEGSALPEEMRPARLVRIALAATGAILGADLAAALPPQAMPPSYFDPKEA